MSWGNYGKWHIDHKIPCRVFDQTNLKHLIDCIAVNRKQTNNEFDKICVQVLNNQWLETYNEDIEKEVEEIKSMLFNLNKLQRNDFFNTTYESVFITKTDIELLCSIIKIENPNWLDILNSKRKLRNGNIGMDNLNPSKRSII
jgi:F0F1-type ATP synthase delta subunit